MSAPAVHAVRGIAVVAAGLESAALAVAMPVRVCESSATVGGGGGALATAEPLRAVERSATKRAGMHEGSAVMAVGRGAAAEGREAWRAAALERRTGPLVLLGPLGGGGILEVWLVNTLGLMFSEVPAM